jgi:hypothetical protein
MENISREDFILVNKETQQPIERLDIVYHYSTVIELVNDGFKLRDNEEFIFVNQLPLALQRQISLAIEATK